MGPAGQRLEAGDLAGLEVDQRLVEQLQLVLVERPAKLGLDREAAPRGARFLGLIDLRLARRLGLLDRELGVAEQLLARPARLHQRDADRAFDADLKLGQLERRRHHLLDPLGRGQRVLDPALQADQDPELIAAGARQHVAAAKRRDQPPGEGDQQLVAGQAAHRFVDPAEAQHVDHQHRIFAVARWLDPPQFSIVSVKLSRLGRPVRLSRSISARRLFSAWTSTVRSTTLSRQRGSPLGIGRRAAPASISGSASAARRHRTWSISSGDARGIAQIAADEIARLARRIAAEKFREALGFAAAAGKVEELRLSEWTHSLSCFRPNTPAAIGKASSSAPSSASARMSRSFTLVRRAHARRRGRAVCCSLHSNSVKSDRLMGRFDV